MSSTRDPDPARVREEVQKCVAQLHKQTELLYLRLFRSGIRLNFLDAELRERREKGTTPIGLRSQTVGTSRGGRPQDAERR